MDGPTLDHTAPYFRPHCLKLNEKTNQYVFKKPQTPFKLVIVIPSDEWERYETALESMNFEEVYRFFVSYMYKHPLIFFRVQIKLLSIYWKPNHSDLQVTQIQSWISFKHMLFHPASELEL
jgi:hypothetical protein